MQLFRKKQPQIVVEKKFKQNGRETGTFLPLLQRYGNKKLLNQFLKAQV